jgi:3-phenylpropionate/trans-cinnamate dioxygenase ferredoxin subunit
MKVVVSRLQDFPPGERRIVEAGKRSIGVFRVEDEFFAIRNRCPHQGGPLCRGPLLRTVKWTPPANYECGRQHLLQCPWHGWEFDIRTGKSWFDPNRWRVKRYDVEVTESGEGAAAAESAGPVDAAALVPGPYEAETYRVTAGRRYVVVEL